MMSTSDNHFTLDCTSGSVNQSNDEDDPNNNVTNINNNNLDDETNDEAFANLFYIISEKNLEKFSSILNKNNAFKLGQINPKVINDILLKCISISNSNEYSRNNQADGCEFIELLMFKLYSTPCYFVCWDDSTCKSICRIYLQQKRQFTPYTICFMLRSNDVNLVNDLIEHNLVEEYCHGDCQNWHLMFVASYQERFFSDCFRNFYEGLVARIILICRLRCSLKQKRYFLTWFAGSLHLFSDEYFLKNEEVCFRQVVLKLFESLILNGLLSQQEFKSLFLMLIKRNEDLLFSLDRKKTAVRQQHTVSSMPISTVTKSTSESQSINKSCLSIHLPELTSLFPLSLKNLARLAIKQNMTNFTQSHIDKLNLPPNLKRFLSYKTECESALRFLNFSKDIK